MSEDFEGLMPGDEVRITGTFMVSTVEESWHGTKIETEDGLEISDFEYEIVTQNRPNSWPPQAGDVWKVDDEYYYYLNDEFVDGDNDPFEMVDYLSENSLTAASLLMVFRPGVTDKLKK